MYLLLFLRFILGIEEFCNADPKKEFVDFMSSYCIVSIFLKAKHEKLIIQRKKGIAAFSSKLFMKSFKRGARERREDVHAGLGGDLKLGLGPP